MQIMHFIGETVPRIGYGTMRLPGPNVMGPPADHDNAINVLKAVRENGIRVIDTAWFYGPDVANELVAEALYPYDDLILVTKLGGKRNQAGDWLPALTPDELRQGMETDRRLLKLDRIPVVHLRVHNGEVDDTFKAAMDTMLDMKAQNLFQHLGLSTVSEAQLDYALNLGPVATVSNAYGYGDRSDDAMVERCADAGIAYLPYFPLGVGKDASLDVVQHWATQLQITPAQLSLAWLLHRSPTMLPIPGTSSLQHLQENIAAGDITLPDDALAALGGLEE